MYIFVYANITRMRSTIYKCWMCAFVCVFAHSCVTQMFIFLNLILFVFIFSLFFAHCCVCSRLLLFYRTTHHHPPAILFVYTRRCRRVCVRIFRFVLLALLQVEQLLFVHNSYTTQAASEPTF